MAVIAVAGWIFWPGENDGLADQGEQNKQEVGGEEPADLEELPAELWVFDFEDEEKAADGWSQLGFTSKDLPKGTPPLHGVNMVGVSTKLRWDRGGIRYREGGDGRINFFRVPKGSLGDWSRAFGGSLQFRIRQRHQGNTTGGGPLVVIRSGKDVLKYIYIGPKPLQWRSMLIPLGAAPEWQLNGVSEEVSADKIREILANVEEVLIRAEWGKGAEETLLDDVRLVDASLTDLARKTSSVGIGELAKGTRSGQVASESAEDERWVVKPKYEDAGSFRRIPGWNGPMFATFRAAPKRGMSAKDIQNIPTGLIRSDGLVLCDPDKGESFPSHFIAPPRGGDWFHDNYFRHHRVIPKLVGGKYGLVDIDGKQVVAPQWDTVGALSEGLFSVQVDGKTGYANLDGEIVIEPNWLEVGKFWGGFAWVREKNGKKKVIDREGRFVSEEVFDDIVRVSARGVSISNRSNEESWFITVQTDVPRGLFWVERDEKWGLFDFSNGAPLGEIQWSGRGGQFREGRSWVHRDRKFGMINLKGEIVLEPVWEASRYKSGAWGTPSRLGDFVGVEKVGKKQWSHVGGTLLSEVDRVAEPVGDRHSLKKYVISDGEIIEENRPPFPPTVLIEKGGEKGFADDRGDFIGALGDAGEVTVWYTSSATYFLVAKGRNEERRVGLVGEDGKMVERAVWRESMELSKVHIGEKTEVPDGHLVAAFWNGWNSPGPGLLLVQTDKLVRVEWKKPSQKAPKDRELARAGSAGRSHLVRVKRHTNDDLRALRGSRKRPKWGYIRVFDVEEVSSALSDARELVRDGKHAEALKRHLWYHEQSKKHRQLTGVRLSFALGAWMRLGEQYPKALAELKRIQDENETQLRSDSPSYEVFHDFHAINRPANLDDVARTIKVYEHLVANDPALAKRCFRIVRRTLLAEGSSLYRKHGGDPEEELEVLIERRGRGLKYAEGKQDRINRANEHFEGEVSVLLKDTARMFGKDRAAALREKALNIYPAAKLNGSEDAAQE